LSSKHHKTRAKTGHFRAALPLIQLLSQNDVTSLKKNNRVVGSNGFASSVGGDASLKQEIQNVNT
jgi:hypothetical protein